MHRLNQAMVVHIFAILVLLVMATPITSGKCNVLIYGVISVSGSLELTLKQVCILEIIHSLDGKTYSVFRDCLNFNGG